MESYPVEIFNESDLEIQLEYHLSVATLVRAEIGEGFNVVFGWLNVVILPNDDHTGLNTSYLGHEYSTDILTFEYVERNVINGEIYINSTVLFDNAKEYEVSFENELNRLIIHGVLHLAGLNDQSEEERDVMTLNEDKYLELVESKGFM